MSDWPECPICKGPVIMATDYERLEALLADKTDKVAELSPLIADLLDALGTVSTDCDEAWTAWVKDGYGTTEPIDFAENTGVFVRAAIAKARKP